MNRNKLLLISIAGASLLAISASQMVWSKAHVPAHKVQMCHRGEVIQVGAPAMLGHVRHGDFQLPACDFANVFFDKQDCSAISDADADGFADSGLNPPIPAGTPSCSSGEF